MEHERIRAEDDHLSLEQITTAWSKVAVVSPLTLMGELVTAFWRGKFERDAHSELFTLLPPDSKSLERRPGNYAIRAGGEIVKVGDDLASHLTAERKRAPIFREVVAYVLCRPEWRGITPDHPDGFAAWSDDKRDVARPNWRNEFEDGYAALSTRPFNQWSSDIRKEHYLQWCTRRHDFSRWYYTSPLSAGTPLEIFWPDQAVHTGTAQSNNIGSDPRARSPRTSRSRYREPICDAAKVVFPDGIPQKLGPAAITRSLMPELSKRSKALGMPKHGPAPITIKRALKGYRRKQDE